MLNCREIEAESDKFIDGEFNPDDREYAEIEVHLKQCEKCRQLIEFRIRLKEMIRTSMSEPTPSSLRSHIFAGLDEIDAELLDAASESDTIKAVQTSSKELSATLLEEEGITSLQQYKEAKTALSQQKKAPNTFFRYAAGAVLIAAAALLIAIVPQWTVAPATTENLTVWEESVDWHRTDIPMEVAGPDAAQVSKWFQGKVNFNVSPLSFGKDVDAQLIGGRLASIHNRRAALLDYKVNGTSVTVLIFDGQGVTVPTDKLQTINNQPIAIIGGAGYDVALFHKNDLTYSITADLPSLKFEHLIHKVLSSN